MLLNEIIQPRVTNVKSRGDNQSINRRVGNTANDAEDTPDQIGKGAYARVEKPKNLPAGQVIKYGKVYGDPEKDGYLSFLKMLSKGDRVAKNPYLPRVYNVKIIDGKQYAAVMEELVPLKELSDSELEVIGDKAFGDVAAAGKKYEENILKVMGNDLGKYQASPRSFKESIEQTAPLSGTAQQPQERPSAQQRYKKTSRAKALPTRMVMAGLMKGVLTNQVPVDAITDKHLKQALMLMKKVVREGGGRGDLHMQNMMARRGPYGAQLVITDPLA